MRKTGADNRIELSMRALNLPRTAQTGSKRDNQSAPDETFSASGICW